MNDVINRDKYSYERIKTLDADGKVKHSSSNGDAVARAMLTLTPDQITDLAEANDVDLDKYKNSGLARMALANRVRALVRKGTAVQIGDVLVKKLDQKVKVEEPPKAKSAPKGKGRAKKVDEEAEAA